MHHDDAKASWWQGSPGLLPNTGTVHVALVVGLPAVQPDSRFRPKKYCVPSVVVTFQYSPSLSPFTAPVRCSTRDPSSFFKCQAPDVSSRISSPACPDSDITALSVAQHSSPVRTVLFAEPPMSSTQPLYPRLIEPGLKSNPSPIGEGWLLDAAM